MIEADGNDFFSEPEYRSQLPQLEAQAFHNFAIHEIQQYGALVEQRNLDAQGREHGCVFEADDAGTHDNQVPRDFFQTVHLIGVEDAVAIHRDIGAVRGSRSAGNQDMLTTDQL